MTLINSKVAMTIKNMVNFGNDNGAALIALSAAMAADRDMGGWSLVFWNPDK